MNITITENGGDCIATVRDGEAPLTFWARHNPDDWAYLGSLSDDGRVLRTRIEPRDITSLADQSAVLEDAFITYTDTLETP